MIKSLIIQGCILSALFFAGCKKSPAPTPPDSNPSVIQIDLPASGTFTTNGSSLVIDGTITDNDVLSSARVEVRNKNTNAVLYQATANTGNVAFYRFHWSWVVTGITTTTPGNVKIIATDKNGYEISKDTDIILDN